MEPRCPKCCAFSLAWGDTDYSIYCRDCGADFDPERLRDFGQFFPANSAVELLRRGIGAMDAPMGVAWAVDTKRFLNSLDRQKG